MRQHEWWRGCGVGQTHHYVTIQIHKYSNVWILEYWILEYWILEYLKSRIFKISNIWYKDVGLEGTDDDDMVVLAAGSAVREVKLRSEK